MKNFFKFILWLSFSLSLTTASAQLYSFTNAQSGAYNSIAANTTATGLTRVNGATAPGTPCAVGFSSTSFTTTTTYTSTLPAMEADITAAAGYQLNVTDFSVGIRRSNTGPANARLAYSINGGTTWIDQGFDVYPNNGSCGATITVTWTTPIVVASPATLQFRIYGFNASGSQGTFQLLDLTIDGTVTTSIPIDSITTTAATFGPFCQGIEDTISVPFTTQSGTPSGTFYVQMSDASGNFPNNATANIISAGGASSPLTAVIPSTIAWANGYRVRVVQQIPTDYTSGDNGNNIVINQGTATSFAITGSPSSVCTGSPIVFTAGSVVGGGASPSFQWYVNGTATATGSIFTDSTLSNSDAIYSTMTSSGTCPLPAVATSNTIHATVYPTAATTVYDTICPGTSLSFNGTNLSVSGIYTNPQSTIHGCDSTITLHLTVRGIIHDSTSITLCQGSSYPFYGTTLSAAGTYTDTTGCDSVHVLILQYTTLVRDTTHGSICQGNSYVYRGATLFTPGVYADTVGCDSIYTLVLQYNTRIKDTLRVNICDGDSYTYRGVSYSTPGTYNDTLGCDSIVTVLLTTSSKPSAFITQNSGDIYMTTSQAFASYQWLFNGQPIAGATGQNDTAWTTGTYEVIVSNASGCSDTSAMVYVVASGINDIGELNVHIYPNPTNGKIHIQTELPAGTASVTIVDNIGRAIYTQNMASPLDQIDISAYTPGVYTFIIRNGDNNTAVRRIVKK